MAYPSGNVGTTYDQVLGAVEAYYGTGSDVWLKVARGDVANFTEQDWHNIQNTPGVTVTRSKNGQFVGWDYEYPFASAENPVASVNSNVPNSTYGSNSSAFKSNVPATVETTTEGGVTTEKMVSGAKRVSTGQKVATVASGVVGTVCAAGLGIKLGKRISQAAYDAGYSWGWTEADWDNWIDSKSPAGQVILRTLFDVDDQNTTMYLPEELLALEYMELKKKGVLDAPQEGIDISHIDKQAKLYYPDNIVGDVICCATENAVGVKSDGVRETYSHKDNCKAFGFKWADGLGIGFVITSGSGAASGITVYRNGSRWTTTRAVNYYAKDGSYLGMTDPRDPFATTYPPASNSMTGEYSKCYVDIGYLVKYGIPTEIPPVTGMDNDPDATDHVDKNLITGNTPQEVLQSLKQNYPDLFNDSIEEEVPQPDGTKKKIKYIPVPYPNTSNKNKPDTGNNHQNNPQVNPLTNTIEELTDLITTIITTITNNPPDTGDGDSPVVPVPTGSASSLWKIYNPTQAQLDSFGSWLWDSSFVEQIKKLFNDPMQAIIGVHKVFASPSIGGTATIKVGYLDSEVSSNWVSNQYTTINCGTVNCREYFGNVFDYAPYTKVSLYLPFIGIVDLDVADVMRGSVSVKYHVDVLTGACLADVIIERDSSGGVIYQYSGSAIVTYPVSSGNYMGMVAGVLSIASGIAGTVLSGGALAPALVGGAVGASHLHTDVSKSGGFSGCAGAMGAKKPYLIISRPQTALADNYEHFTGLPANSHVTLSQCSGLTKVKSVYVGAMQSATDEEKDMIEAQLKAGVLI